MFNILKKEEILPYSKVQVLVGVVNINELLVEPNFYVLNNFHPLFKPIIGILGTDNGNIYNIEESETTRKMEEIFNSDVSTIISTFQKIGYGYELNNFEKKISDKINDMIKNEYNEDYKLTVLIGKEE